MSAQETDIALQVLKNVLTERNLKEYQRKRAIARRTIKTVKREAWWELCSTIGKGTEIGEVWKI